MENKTLGIMLDCSRNAVMKVSTVKKYVDVIQKMGYNALMLYTEDTYEIKGEPYFGYMRGRYTQEEIKEIDAYCKLNGVELIPCVQTLAHYTTLFRWEEYSDIHDTADILLIDEDKTYEFIEKIIRTCKQNFSSKRINIGMDEAHMVGLGKYLDKHGYQNRYELLLRHLDKVCKLCDKYGYKPMMWSDMPFRLANHGEYYMRKPFDFDEKALNLPKNVELVYWDYYKASKERAENMLDMHIKFNRKIWYASGSWTWSGIVPHNRFSIDSTRVGMKACRDRKIKDVFTTLWGDNGAECSKFSVLPAVFAQAEFIKGDDIDKEKFKDILGISYDDYLLLDLPDFIHSDSPHNPDKYGLYNDYFLGLYDGLDETKDLKTCEKITLARKKLEKVRAGEWQYLFDTIIALCKVLEVKFSLGVKTRTAYKNKDINKLQKLVDNDYTVLPSLIENLHKAFRLSWLKENKPFGLEVHEARLGGLALRTKSCKQRLQDFISGKIDKIDELEQEVLVPSKEVQAYFNKNDYLQTITAGIT